MSFLAIDFKIFIMIINYVSYNMQVFQSQKLRL